MMGKAQIHIHTVEGDGIATAEQLLERAVQLGMNVIAFTDHDQLFSSVQAREIVARSNLPIEVIPAIEITASILFDHIIALFPAGVPSFTTREMFRGVEETVYWIHNENGIAILADKPAIKKWIKNKDGSFSTFKEMFTPHCIQSIKQQAQHKRLFVDIKHELIRDASIREIIKDKLSKDDQESIDLMLKRKMLPLAKINDVDVEGNSLNIYTELNPMFREVDEDHKNYFDAVWYSLEHKYLNGISANFANFKIAVDEQGNDVIDDVDILGFSYEDNPVSSEHSITEVAIRAMEEGRNSVEEKKMEDEKKILELERKNLENEKVKYSKDKEELETEKLRLKTMQEEQEKKAEIEKQAEVQKKIESELAEKTKLAKENSELKDELNRAKGVVAQKPNPNVPSGNSQDSKFYEENIKKITAEHDSTMETFRKGKVPMIDKTMSGFGEMVNLQAKANDFTADLIGRTDENGTPLANIIRGGRLIDRGDSDLITPKWK